MDITENFEFRKMLLVDRNITESHTRIDISNVKDSVDKLDEGIRGFLGFLTSSGFDSNEILGVMMAILKELVTHPDNDDFSMQSLIEEQVNNEKEFNQFINAVKESEDNKFLKEVFRSWILTHIETDDEDD